VSLVFARRSRLCRFLVVTGASCKSSSQYVGSKFRLYSGTSTAVSGVRFMRRSQ